MKDELINILEKEHINDTLNSINTIDTTDKHCGKLIKLVTIYKRIVYILSCVGFFGIAFMCGEFFDNLPDTLNFCLSVSIALIVTFFNVFFTMGLYELINVLTEIARNTRK
ncbi:hypothetical protein [uncultured Bacteroides sp.]|jgi:hypothetical protein|uniref:hypothetical protein n=1 Tax=uncultured Bacteroides sp. TaxID=162156 RepID=UPI00259B52C1|nr:hypothetical protein [uncultured Bacteroides sp.]